MWGICAATSDDCYFSAKRLQNRVYYLSYCCFKGLLHSDKPPWTISCAWNFFVMKCSYCLATQSSNSRYYSFSLFYLVCSSVLGGVSFLVFPPTVDDDGIAQRTLYTRWNVTSPLDLSHKSIWESPLRNERQNLESDRVNHLSVQADQSNLRLLV